MNYAGRSISEAFQMRRVSGREQQQEQRPQEGQPQRQRPSQRRRQQRPRNRQPPAAPPAEASQVTPSGGISQSKYARMTAGPRRGTLSPPVRADEDRERQYNPNKKKQIRGETRDATEYATEPQESVSRAGPDQQHESRLSQNRAGYESTEPRHLLSSSQKRDIDILLSPRPSPRRESAMPPSQDSPTPTPHHGGPDDALDDAFQGQADESPDINEGFGREAIALCSCSTDIWSMRESKGKGKTSDNQADQAMQGKDKELKEIDLHTRHRPLAAADTTSHRIEDILLERAMRGAKEAQMERSYVVSRARQAQEDGRLVDLTGDAISRSDDNSEGDTIKVAHPGDSDARAQPSGMRNATRASCGTRAAPSHDSAVTYQDRWPLLDSSAARPPNTAPQVPRSRRPRPPPATDKDYRATNGNRASDALDNMRADTSEMTYEEQWPHVPVNRPAASSAAVPTRSRSRESIPAIGSAAMTYDERWPLSRDSAGPSRAAPTTSRYRDPTTARSKAPVISSVNPSNAMPFTPTSAAPSTIRAPAQTYSLSRRSKRFLEQRSIAQTTGQSFMFKYIPDFGTSGYEPGIEFVDQNGVPARSSADVPYAAEYHLGVFVEGEDMHIDRDWEKLRRVVGEEEKGDVWGSDGEENGDGDGDEDQGGDVGERAEDTGAVSYFTGLPKRLRIKKTGK